VIARYKRPNPKRKTPRAVHSERTAHLNGGHKRVRLIGIAKTLRRLELFQRSRGRCEDEWPEDCPEFMYIRCNRRINSDTYDPAYNPRGMQWSHNRHAANKCDCMACGIASCAECHAKRHNAGGKPITVRKKDIA
jgi:hypothetical protein